MEESKGLQHVALMYREDAEHQDERQDRASSRIGRKLATVGVRSIHRVCQQFQSQEGLRDTAWLDGLRGLASFQVYVLHSSYEWGFYDSRRLSVTWRQNEEATEFWRLPYIRLLYGSGSVMVPIFFIISGFVLTQKSLRHIRSKQHQRFLHDLSSTAFRRIFRIWFPTMIASAISMSLFYAGLGWKFNSCGYDTSMTMTQFIMSWFSELNRSINIFTYRDRLNQTANKYARTSWTLPLEIYGSFVCYFLMLIQARMSRDGARIFVTVALGSYAAYNQSWYVVLFLFGVFLADYDLILNDPDSALGFKPLFPPALSKLFWTGTLLTSLWISGWEILFDPLIVHDMGTIWWLSVAGSGIVTSIYHLPTVRSFFDSPAMQFLGRVSFGLYCVHFPFIDQINKPYLRPFMFSLFSESASHWIIFAIQTVAVLVMGHYFAVYIDSASIKAAKRLETTFVDE